MLSDWRLAKVVHSVPEASWGLAETSEKKVIFFRDGTAVILRLLGSDLVSAGPTRFDIPAKGSEIVFRGLVPAVRGGNYPQAERWTPREYFETLRPSAENAAATLAQLAAENAAAERKRRELRERLDRLNAGKKQKNKGKRAKAHASA